MRYAHVILSFGISHFPRTMTEHEQGLKEGNHHPLPRSLHDHAREKNNMVSPFVFRIQDCAQQGIRFKDYICVGEQQPLASGFRSCQPHGMGFSEPVGWKIVDMNNPEPSACARRDPLHDRPGCIAAAVIDRDYFEIGVIDSNQTRQRSFNLGGFITRRNNDAHTSIARGSSRTSIPLGPGNVRDLSHSKSSA